MRVRCPHCHNPIEVVDADPLTDISCPDCGSNFSLISGETDSYTPGAVKTIGHFEFLESVGGGHFGTVWKARDTKLDRIVAVKVPRRGQIEGPEAEMFVREARSAAQVKHPGVVAVHEVGRENDTLYIVTDFVDGCNLKDWLSGRRLTPREAAEVCVKIADALHAAHEAGVVHRDLKPGNVMMDLAGEPHLTDFGLAKREAGEITMTVDGQVLGTPAYMSPEQARGEAHKADRRSDVYSLGVILFELLTGELPFRGSQRMMIVQILQEEPPALRRLNNRIPRDLETICLKCLQKEPSRRYATAAELAEDLGRYLRGEPTLARPFGKAGRLWRWCKRQPVVAALVSAIALLLVLGTVVSSYFAITAITQRKRADEKTKEALANASRADTKALEAKKEQRRAEDALKKEAAARREADTQRRKADEEKESAERNLYYTRIALAHQKWLSAEVGEAERILNSCPTRFRHWEWGYLQHLCHLDLRTLRGHLWEVTSVCFSPDGKRLATASMGGTAQIWDVASGRTLLTVHGDRLKAISDFHAYSCCFSPDGKRLAFTSYDKTVKILDAFSGQEVLTLRGHASYVNSVCFSSDGRRLATTSDDKAAKIWDAVSGRELLTLRGYTNACFSPDGKRLATASNDSTAKIWDATSGQNVLTLRGHAESVSSVCFSPDGRRLATTSYDNSARIWDANSGQELLTLRGHSGAVDCACFSPNGKHLATAGVDSTARIWDAVNGEELVTIRGHKDQVHSVCFSPDGKRLATASVDSTAKIWNVANEQGILTLRGHASIVIDACFSPDGKRLATASNDNSAKIWDAISGQELLVLRGHTECVNSICFSPDGKRLATASSDKTAKIWNATNGKELLTVRGHTQFVNSVCFSPDGTRLATTSYDNSTKIWDATNGQELLNLCGHKFPVFGVCFSPDGKQLATASGDTTVKIWDAANGQELFTLRGHAYSVYSVCFSPDGKRLATASYDRTAKVWDTTNGQEVLTLRGHSGEIRAVCFSPDGKRLATASGDQTARVWDAVSGQEVLTLRGHTQSVESVRFSRDGKRLATASLDRTAKIWDATGEQEVDKNWSPLPPALPIYASVDDIPGFGWKPRLPNAKKLVDAVERWSWSPDGTRIAFVFNKTTTMTALRILTIASGEIRDCVDDVHDPAWSPGDGCWIAFARRSKGGPEVTWLVRPDGGQPKRLCDGGFSSWSADGKTLYVFSATRKKILVVQPDSRSALMTEVVDMAWPYPAISPDGKRIAFLKDSNLTVIDRPTGKQLRSCMLDGWRGLLASWSPDGKQLAYGSFGARNSVGLWILDVESGRRFKVVDGPYTMPAWSSDGSKFALVATAAARHRALRSLPIVTRNCDLSRE